MGHLTTDACAVRHDGSHYLADLNETVPKMVVCTGP